MAISWKYVDDLIPPFRSKSRIGARTFYVLGWTIIIPWLIPKLREGIECSFTAGKRGKELAVHGYALLNPRDEYDQAVGMKMALRRLMEYNLFSKRLRTYIWKRLVDDRFFESWDRAYLQKGEKGTEGYAPRIRINVEVPLHLFPSIIQKRIHNQVPKPLPRSLMKEKNAFTGVRSNASQFA